ncbi:GTPase Era [Thermoleophilia bacterium SCSIO 60948]|nr:GTPase Era [Thermoleophilia bacterium SCSIO 60948]
MLIGTEGTRSGFVGLAGRPNAGKSTLVNAIVGAKVAIVSDRPQTTRRAIRGVATDAEAGWQMILTDLPGVQRPRDHLTQRMQKRVERELVDSDVALLVLNAEQGVGPGDRFIADTMLGARRSAEGAAATPVICAVNKCDRLKLGGHVEVLSAAAELEVVDEIFPISARRGDGVADLVARLAELLPAGPFMYEPDTRSDLSSEVHLAELVREQVLRRTRAEVPHAVEVRLDEFEHRDDGIFEIHAQVWVETPSQKGIVIGKGGKMIGDIGTAARKVLETELGGQVFLDLEVQVRDHWRREGEMLDRLGIE